jgi:hypothetical protein
MLKLAAFETTIMINGHLQIKLLTHHFKEI